VNVARHCENILLETGWGVLPRLLEAARALGPSRLVFGSDTPPMEPFSQLRVVECLAWDPPLGVKWSEAQVEQVMGDNLAALLKLTD
jgi:predicted TIM-barrel fold metal-dependent hydrolase